MELTRHQGLGNVFLIALLEELPEDPSELAQKYCDSNHGIGADGFFIVCKVIGIILAGLGY